MLCFNQKREQDVPLISKAKKFKRWQTCLKKMLPMITTRNKIVPKPIMQNKKVKVVERCSSTFSQQRIKSHRVCEKLCGCSRISRDWILQKKQTNLWKKSHLQWESVRPKPRKDRLLIPDPFIPVNKFTPLANPRKCGHSRGNNTYENIHTLNVKASDPNHENSILLDLEFFNLYNFLLAYC